MISARQKFVLGLHLTGLLALLVLTTLTAVLLWRAYAATGAPGAVTAVVRGTIGFVLVGIALEQILVRLLLERVLKPTGKAARVAGRIADGDLTPPEWTSDPARAPKDALSQAVVTMITRLRDLVGAIRQHAHEAAAMAQEIAASTQQMSASTQEVASTTGDLT
jgi:methyl-accepting chemotaxis protein